MRPVGRASAAPERRDPAADEAGVSDHLHAASRHVQRLQARPDFCALCGLRSIHGAIAVHMASSAASEVDAPASSGEEGVARAHAGAVRPGARPALRRRLEAGQRVGERGQRQGLPRLLCEDCQAGAPVQDAGARCLGGQAGAGGLGSETLWLQCRSALGLPTRADPHAVCKILHRRAAVRAGGRPPPLRSNGFSDHIAGEHRTQRPCSVCRQRAASQEPPRCPAVDANVDVSEVRSPAGKPPGLALGPGLQ